MGLNLLAGSRTLRALRLSLSPSLTAHSQMQLPQSGTAARSVGRQSRARRLPTLARRAGSRTLRALRLFLSPSLTAHSQMPLPQSGTAARSVGRQSRARRLLAGQARARSAPEFARPDVWPRSRTG